MFTGIIQAQGTVAQCVERDGDMQLTIDAGDLATRIDAARLAVGESIAVNGVCLTVVAFDGLSFLADVSRETLALTSLRELRAGSRVNLEPALRAGDPLGGHLVSGHVDGLAQVISLHGDARSLRVQLEVPESLARYIAPKGSVALDGVSLTVNEVDRLRFGVNLIPHTAAVTGFGQLATGQRLNLEVDQLARYVERLLGR
ncbi:MAG: riboflavin synthase [Pseudomonadota bacterium]